eukprot:14588320-Alexandrium_andersonii.AAC.1
MILNPEPKGSDRNLQESSRGACITAGHARVSRESWRQVEALSSFREVPLGLLSSSSSWGDGGSLCAPLLLHTVERRAVD